MRDGLVHHKEAVAIKPGSAEMQVNLGSALARKGNWAEAIFGENILAVRAVDCSVVDSAICPRMALRSIVSKLR